jgi:hypothetical protein
VRFVENHEVIGKQIAALVFLRLRDAAQREKEQGVIENDDIRGDERLAHGLVVAARIAAAALGGADVGLAANLRPDVRIRLHREVA